MFWLFVAGIVGGLIGGMGMGGGTLLIPILTLIIGMNQHSAQAANLIAFIPMSIVVLIIHAKNKLVEFKRAIPIIIGGVGAGVLGAILIKDVAPKFLKICFGVFLLLMGAMQLVLILFVKKKSSN